MPYEFQLKEAILRTRFNCNDAEKHEFTDYEVLFALNQAKNTLIDVFIERVPEFFYKTSVGDAVADQTTYSLPTDTRTLDRVEIGDATYTPITPMEAANTYAGYFCVMRFAGTSGSRYPVVDLYPAPTEDDAGGITFHYLAEVADALSDESYWSMPASLMEVICLRAALDLFATRDRRSPALEVSISMKLEALSGLRHARTSGGMKFSSVALRVS
jgi:hypothetical protein